MERGTNNEANTRTNTPFYDYFPGVPRAADSTSECEFFYS